MSPVEISIPAQSVYVGIVRLALGSLARSAGFDEERVDDIRIAVSEACTNAVLNTEEAGAPDAIVVAWLEDEDRVQIEISDRAPGGDGVAPESLDSQGFSSRMMMSVALLREIADDLAFEPRPQGGTTTRLTFARSV